MERKFKNMRKRNNYLAPDCQIFEFGTDSGFASSPEVGSAAKVEAWNSDSDADNDWFKEN